MDPYTLVSGHQFHLLCYNSEFQGSCGQTERQCFELVGLTLDMESQVFSGMFLYRDMEVSIFEIYRSNHSPVWREVLMVSGVSILNFSTLRKRLSLLKSSMGLHLLFGFGTKNSRLKKPRDFWFCTSSIAFLSVS